VTEDARLLADLAAAMQAVADASRALADHYRAGDVAPSLRPARRKTVRSLLASAEEHEDSAALLRAQVARLGG
jgi:hypothetical protein